VNDYINKWKNESMNQLIKSDCRSNRNFN